MTAQPTPAERLREWFAAKPDCPLAWTSLAADALTFARLAGRRSGR